MSVLTDRAVAAGEAVPVEDLTHRRRRKVSALTGIRGIAALWVVAFHLTFVAENRFPGVLAGSMPIIGYGYLGVDLFFILSGCVLMANYGSEFETDPFAAAGRFAVGRVFRIMPLNAAVLGLFAITSPVLHGDWISYEPHTAYTWWLAVLLVQAWTGYPRVWNVPAWSLSAEWLAYCAFPLLVLAMARLRRPVALATAIYAPLALLAVVFAVRTPFAIDYTNRLGLVRCLAEFGAGMALGRTMTLWTLTAARGEALLAAAGALLAFAMIGGRAGLLALPAFTLLIAACAAPTGGPADRLFGNQLSHFLGEISFSIYLLHWLFLQIAVSIADRATLSPGAAVLLLGTAALVTIPAAWLSWRWIEHPAQSAGRSAMAYLCGGQPFLQR